MLPAGPPPPDNAQTGHIVSTDPESVQLRKKTYLSLLPPLQIIEICLAFEAHVPLQIRNTVWPIDLDAAIAKLRICAPAPQAVTAQRPTPGSNTLQQEVHPPGREWGAVGNGDPPMGSLQGPEQAENLSVLSKTLSVPPESAAGAPSPNLTASASASPAPPSQPINVGQPSSSSPPTPIPAPPDAPAIHAVKQSTPQPASHQSHSPYPYAPYSYPYQSQSHPPAQSGYPHAPYYPPPYPYPGYPSAPGYPAPAPTHQPYAPPAPPRPHPPQASTSTVIQPPLPPPPPSMDDLPSYEDMIVEALLDNSDPEGAAPKELFAWMAARYPLQTNFRPSASQALQKAFKRGRLGKSAGGRYRVNPTWEGGATSKRTTRRPQTHAQTTFSVQQNPPAPAPAPSSPFTHAPLTHPQPPAYPPQNGAPGQPPYPGYGYGYPAGYPPPPGYPYYPTPQEQDAAASGKPFNMAGGASSSSAAPAPAPAVSGSTPEKPADSSSNEHHELWEATQHILKAIGVTQAAAAHPPPVVAGAGPRLGEQPGAGTVQTVLTDEERASLQHQLALLASQLAEIAEEEEEEEEAEDDHAEIHDPAADGDSVDSRKRVALDVNQFAEVLAEASTAAAAPAWQQDGSAMEVAEEAGDDSDEDMEMVEVPVFAGHDALRT